MENVPYHVGIILDGNGRWAKKRGLPRTMGHLKGIENLESLAPYIFDQGVKVLSVFAFSTENFKRDKQEVDFIMNLFLNNTSKLFKKCSDNNIKIVFSKKASGLGEELEKMISKLEHGTKDNQAGILNICMNYGSQDEIIEMTKKIAKKVKNGTLDIDMIDKETINDNLYHNLPPIDFLIRTSGELRLSNFMLYQLAYAELYFPKTFFPDFNEKEFDKALLVYQKRDRRFGNVV